MRKPPIDPPGQGGNPPPYMQIITDTVDSLNSDLKPYSTDDRLRIMDQIYWQVEHANEVQGTLPS